MADPAPSIVCDTAIEAGDWRDLAHDAAIRRALEAVTAAGDLAADPPPADTALELSLLLTDDAHIRELNRRWRGQDKPTNVLSFPAEDRVPGVAPLVPMLGDVVMAHETLHREAQAQGKRTADHFAHLLIHGVLHLFGHDHDTDERAALMEGIEVRALRTLGIADPYAHNGATPA